MVEFFIKWQLSQKHQHNRLFFFSSSLEYIHIFVRFSSLHQLQYETHTIYLLYDLEKRTTLPMRCNNIRLNTLAIVMIVRYLSVLNNVTIFSISSAKYRKPYSAH